MSSYTSEIAIIDISRAAGDIKLNKYMTCNESFEFIAPEEWKLCNIHFD